MGKRLMEIAKKEGLQSQEVCLEFSASKLPSKVLGKRKENTTKIKAKPFIVLFLFFSCHYLFSMLLIYGFLIC